MALISRIAESGRLSQFRLTDINEVMPTRLGMVMRFYESLAGEPYGLNSIQVMPYMARVAKADDMAYVNDQRSQLDLAVRMSVTALFACVLTIVMLWRDGLWLLVGCAATVSGRVPLLPRCDSGGRSEWTGGCGRHRAQSVRII